jgi:5-methyltetrahydrofolate--homocysteine methyltransferase
MRDFLAATRERVVVFDGGMGATLEMFDLSLEKDYGLPGRAHEVLVLNRPDVIEGVHTSMIEAGAQVLETCTFQASRLKLGEWGLEDHTMEINVRAAQLARKAAGEHNFVAGSIGPTGFLPASDDPTLGQISFRELVEVFSEQARGLVEGGSDLLIIETAQDILEVKAAIFGAREAFTSTGRKLPIQISVSLLPNGGKMLLGTDIASALTTLTALEVDAVGLNCSTGPEDMRDAIRFLGEYSTLPIHCIPNAGLPLQGPNGETIFPALPEPLAAVLGEYVERYGVNIVGGCCGTTPDHIRAIAERVAHVAPREPQSESWAGAQVSSMIAATPLVQAPTPTLVGERVNSQGSRKAKEMLLADDYDGLLQVAEDQVEGGAHVLDVCVALTERQDEAEQMRQVVKRISLSQPSPIQIDSTEPDVIEAALEQIPGRAIVNSVNLEAGPAKLNVVAPLAKAHGAALIALTIDEVGMAKTRERKLEIAQRIVELVTQHRLAPEDLIFDCLTFTLTTGDEEWRPSAIETIEGIRLIKENIPGVKTSLGVSNVSFGVGLPARQAINSVFLHHCVEAGLDLAMVNPNHITPYGEIPDFERELADDLVYNKRPDALERLITHFEAKGVTEEASSATDPTEGMEPEEALHFHILRRKKDGVEVWIDRCNDKIGAVPTLNTVLLPAMKEVGDKFGAGELILPFVLQSAEVMKRAVAQLEKYLDKIEGYTKGTVVLATVFGDVHDIGKSLVNTILTNNGYTVIDLGKQVPISTILEAAQEHKADAIGLSALLVSTSKQMPAAIQELHSAKHPFPVLIGGAAINRNFGLRISYPNGSDNDEIYEPGVFFCKDAFEGLGVMDQLVDPDAREALVQKTRAAAKTFRDKPAPAPSNLPPTTDDSVRSAAATDNPVPTPPYWGVREIPVDLDEVYPHLDTHVLFKLHWGGKGVQGEAWERLVQDDFKPRLERMWAGQDYLHPRALLGYFPVNSDGNELIFWDPEAPGERELERMVFPRQPGGDRICLADFYRPLGSGEVDVAAIQAVTAGDQVTDLMAKLEQDGEFAEQLFVHGIGTQCAEGMAEWMHARIRTDLGVADTQGRRYSWGYSACPEQSEHEKVFRLLDAPQIGLRLSGAYALEPEQSTMAIVAHHPQAVYFTMSAKTGLPKNERQAADDIIRGSEYDPTRLTRLPDADPDEGPMETSADAAAVAGA